MATAEFHGSDLIVNFHQGSGQAPSHFNVQYVCGTSTVTHRVEWTDQQSEDSQGVRHYQDTLSHAENQATGLTRTPTVQLTAVAPNGDRSSTVSITAQNSIPVLPTAPAITPTLTGVTVDLQQPADADLMGFICWVDGNNNVRLDDAHKRYQGGSTSFAIALPDDSSYWMRVAPYDAFGLDLTSAWSAIQIHRLTSPLTDTVPPAAPTGLALGTSVFRTDGLVDQLVNWNANAELDFASYELQAATNGGGWITVATGTTPTFTITGLLPATSVQARVRAKDRSGNLSDWSSTFSGTIAGDTIAPAAPSGLNAIGAIGNIVLAWTNPADADLATVEVWDGPSSDIGAASLLATLPAAPSGRGGYVRGKVTTGTNRTFWLRAIDTSGNTSPYSNSASATAAAVTGADIAVDSVLANSVIANTSTVTGSFASNVVQNISSLPGQLTIDGTGFNLSTVASNAAASSDPASRINANSTLITPGRIQLTGGTTLTNWIYGGDNTLINGGSIAANTITANKVTIGTRGVQLLDINFDTNRSNTVTWSAGYVEWADDAGNRRVDYMRGGSQAWDPSNPVAVVWVWFDRAASPNHFGDGSGCLWAGMPGGGAAEILGNPNNVILASYRNGNQLIAYNGRTIVDGDYIKTGTVAADRIISNSITSSQIAAGGIDASSIRAGSIDTQRLSINGVEWSNLNISTLARGPFSASATWANAYVPTNGETITLPFGINCGTIKPSGGFTATCSIGYTTTAGQRYSSTYNGYPAYTTYIGDGGVAVYCQDNQGNTYSFTNGTTYVPVYATTDFTANVIATISHGNYDTGYVSQGDYYTHELSADWSVSSISLTLRWSAV